MTIVEQLLLIIATILLLVPAGILRGGDLIELAKKPRQSVHIRKPRPRTIVAVIIGLIAAGAVALWSNWHESAESLSVLTILTALLSWMGYCLGLIIRFFMPLPKEEARKSGTESI